VVNHSLTEALGEMVDWASKQTSAPEEQLMLLNIWDCDRYALLLSQLQLMIECQRSSNNNALVSSWQ
jgi:hypothetical protein